MRPYLAAVMLAARTSSVRLVQSKARSFYSSGEMLPFTLGSAQSWSRGCGQDGAQRFILCSYARSENMDRPGILSLARNRSREQGSPSLTAKAAMKKVSEARVSQGRQSNF